MTTRNIPTSRRIVLRLAVLFTRVFSRVTVTDAHNGFRAFNGPGRCNVCHTAPLFTNNNFRAIGVRAPENLSILVLDNRHFGETGMQASHTGLGTDLCAVARACSIARVMEASSMDDVAALRAALHRPDGCLFARIAISAREHERVMPERDGAKIKDRVREALGLT